MEADIGILNFTILYLLSGVGGITFSALTSDNLSVGASTAIFGLIGSYVSFIIINFNYLKSKPQKFFTIAIFLFLALILSFALGNKVSKSPYPLTPNTILLFLYSTSMSLAI